MNQILLINETYKKVVIKGYIVKKKKIKKQKKNLWFYRGLLSLSLIGVIISISYSIYGYESRNKKEKLSNSLSESFNISTLYAKDNSYTAEQMYTTEVKNTFSVIGIIKIDSIKISYPILSNINDDLLKISPCRFYGPMPNEIGNICIAAHNYNDNRFFSKVGKLKKGDIITIYDNIGNYKFYSIYNVFETKMDNLSCTSQDTNNAREVTLVTCNNLNGNRIIVKAKEY